MQQHVANMAFEKAEMVKKKLEYLENYQARSVIVSKHVSNVDVFSILKDGDAAYVNYLMVQNGTIVQTHTVQLETHLEETEAEVLSFAVGNLRETFNSLANEIIVPFEIEYTAKDVLITIPKSGDKRKLLDLSIKNVNYFKEEIKKKKMLHLEQKTDAEKKNVLTELKDYLQLHALPVHIECFDNSNFQGSFPVSAMVCFSMAYQAKKITGILM